MTEQTNTTGMEFCKTCGTMLLMGICRRCTPDIKPISAINAAQPVKKQRVNNYETHALGVSIAVDRLNCETAPASVADISGVDLTLDDGRTVLVRAMSGAGRVVLINGALDTLAADFLVIATNVYNESRSKLYIMEMAVAKAISETAYCNRDGHDEHFINDYEYDEYQNNYSILV